MAKWNPSKDDVRTVCEAILDNFIAINAYHGGDDCHFCGENYGNYDRLYHNKGITEPHRKGCPVLVARDILTGFD